jgi:hypothetical protein
MFGLPASRKLGTALPAMAVLSALLLFGCHDSLTEPEFARVNNRYQLTITGGGSLAGGGVTSDRGGISCTVAASGAVSGKCVQQYKSGAIVTLYLAPSAGAELKFLGSACVPAAENPLACNVVMTANMTVNVNFSPQSSTVTLTINGGAGGSGSVTSSPTGISCTITNGAAGSNGCAGVFALNVSVTISATAASGSYLKAWAGAGCDASGTGAGKSVGQCTVLMSEVLSVIVSFDRPADVALTGQWGSPFTWTGLAIHSHLLPNGKVLTWGRSDNLPVLWDPVSNAFGNTARPVDLFCSGHALLPDGRLLAAGGHSGIDDQGIRSTAIYDYATNAWTTGPAMRNGRWYPTVTALPNGEMLTISGGDTAKVLNRIPEVWTPGATTGTWRALTSALANIPYYPMMFAAPDGTVFVAGPDQSTGFLNTTGTGSWTTGPLRTFGDRDYGSAVMYEPGKIVVIGGGAPTKTAEKIDLNPGAGLEWTDAGSMTVARRQMNATLLADGTVLVTGGTNASGFNNMPTDDNVLAAERWNPASGDWTQLARQTRYRVYHSTALLLADGRVLSVGSGQPTAIGLSDDFMAEVFSPPYLFNPDGTAASRPAITASPSSVTYGMTFSVGTTSATSVVKVTWIRLGSVTHATDMNQRLNYLSFTAPDSTSLSVTAPANALLAPPGHYMLFLLDENGVPSIARIVRIS